MNEFNKKEEYDKRFNSMLNSDFGMFTKDNENYDVINFDNYNRYNVVIRGRFYSCDCQDFVGRCRYHRIPCKHIMFVKHNLENYNKSAELVITNLYNYFKNYLEVVK